ncbi:MAG TPA: YciI family protein [Longimicrobium sp.]
MRYLCLIYWNEHELATLPADELNALNAAHLDFNDALRRSGHYVEAEALQPPAASTCLRIKGGKPVVTDGPFAEAKEVVAGFYLLEVRDRDEALEVAARIPSATHATVEVRPVHTLVVEGRAAD